MNNQTSSMQQEQTVPLPKTTMHSSTFLQRLVNGWWRLSGPDAQSFGNSIAEQGRLRRARMVSLLFPLALVAIVLSLPDIIVDPIYWIPVVLLLLFSVVAIVCNRRGWVTTAGLSFVLGVDITLITLLVTHPSGLGSSNIPDLDLFVLSLFIAGTILPRIFVPLFAAMHICIILLLFLLIPHNVILSLDIAVNLHGFVYALVADALILQVCGGMLAYLAAWGVDTALERANRAEELAETRAHLDVQNQQMLAQQQRLAYGIHVLKDVQTQVANGDYNARARLQDNELVPLALGLNLMIERLSRVSHCEQEYESLEQALRQLIDVQMNVLYQKGVPSYRQTGTLVDKVYPMLETYAHLNTLVLHCMTSIDKLRTTLQMQKAQVVRLNSMQALLRSLAQFLFQDGTASLSRVVDTGPHPTSDVSWERRLDTEPTLAIMPSNYQSRLRQHVQLIEETNQLSAQIQELNAQAIQEVKLLNLELKGTEY